MKKIDITGQTFGSLTVIREVHKNNKSHPYWLCQCGCGQKIAVDSYALRSGRKTSCGCGTKKKSKSKEDLNSIAKKAMLAGTTYGKYVAGRQA